MPPPSTSVREVPVSVTIQRALPVARRLGITRCAEATRLDYVGIPVFCATRPRAAAVCVTAGKGLHSADANAGALMEGIEHAVAEAAARDADITWATPSQVASQGGPTIMSLGPRIGQRVDPQRRVPWVYAKDIVTGKHVSLPPELVFFPCPESIQQGYYGSNTTGLGCGNTKEEAILHALCEVIERDTMSFEQLGARSTLVAPESLPAEARGAYQALRAAGLRVWLRTMPTAPGIPYFSCLIVDDEVETPLRCNGGYGCHPVASIAAVRALCEAAQSRVSYIQGARDDIEDSFSFFGSMGSDELRRYRDTLIDRHSDSRRVVSFGDIPGANISSPARLLDELTQMCARRNFTPIYVYSFPSLAAPFTAVRVIVPKAEDFSHSVPRAGARLVLYARTSRRSGVSGP